MKLNAKFGLSIGTFIAVSAALSLYLIFSFAQVIELRNYQIQTSNTINEWFRLRITLTDMFTVSLDTETAEADWNARIEAFDGEFSVVTKSPVRKSLGKETNAEIAKAENMYALISKSFPPLGEEIGNIAKAEIPPLAKNLLKSSGLSALYYGSAESGSILLFYKRLSDTITKMNIYSDPFQEILATTSELLEADVASRVYRVTAQSFILLAIISALIFFAITRITARITKRLKTITSATGKLAMKEFPEQLRDASRDEIGELSANLNESVSILNGFMNGVKSAATEATSMSESIDASAEDVMTATTQISTNLGSMEKQFDNIKTTVESATNALETMSAFLVNFMTDLSRQNSSVTESSASIAEMNRSITLISRESREKAESITALKDIATEGEQKIETTESILVGVTEKLDDVYSFIAIINSIAEQTSILSMNAAIESAHAGEAGKGFAVVADEIQKLAESTAENAQLIGTTLTEIITNVQEARDASQAATRAFNDTTGAIDGLSSTLKDIVAEIISVEDKSGTLAERSEEVSRSTTELSTKTDKLDSLRQTVIREIGEMERVFAESRSGITEINVGTEDILTRIMRIHDLSTQSRKKMEGLRAMLSEFKARADEAEPDAEELTEEV